ncbi:FHA domain-containing protein [Nonomuraea harbinensis]|uniref:FHA domain-containing protein n=1 Tax=Nonomuraea harbinensis TaxID=1286938 RepID=A0ABW1C9J7_9ACTN|nr:FHA domain-containing protein [Nonomuraea harbinensis]
MASAKHGPRSKVDLLPKESVSGGLPADVPGSLYVRGTNGGIRVAPDAGFDVVFGRCEPDVHVCVGLDDPYVSRQHGFITYENARWVLCNLGNLPIRLPGGRLVLTGHRAPLPVAHTPLFIVAPRQEHLFETRIVMASHPATRVPQEADTRDPDGWPLSTVERLVLVCLGQRYLRPEPWPQPLTWAQVADELGRLRPADKWTAKRAAHIVTQTRKRLSAKVPGLLEEEIPPPLGNTLNHNLIMALLVSATIGPSDLRLLDEPAGPPPGTVDPIP